MPTKSLEDIFGKNSQIGQVTVSDSSGRKPLSAIMPKSSSPIIVPKGDTSPEGFMASHPWLKKWATGAKESLGRMAQGPIGVGKSLLKTGEVGAEMLGKATGIEPVMTEEFKKDIEPEGALQKIGALAGSVAQTAIAPGSIAPKAAIEAKMAYSGLKEGLMGYAQTGDVGSGVLAGSLGAALPGVGEIAPKAQKAIKEGTEKALGWISQKSYAQALKPLLSKELGQKVSQKVSELAPIGTKGGLRRMAQRVMGEFETTLNKVMKTEKGDIPINVDEVLQKTEGYLEPMARGEVISTTGQNQLQKFDELRQNLANLADRNGFMPVKKMQSTVMQLGKDIKKLFKRDPATLTPAEQADINLYFGMRDAIAEKFPEVAEANAKYHIAKIIDDSIKRTEGIELRQNWTGLIGNIYAVEELAKGKIGKAVGALVLDKVFGGTLARTALGAGAKGLQRSIQKSLNIPEYMAKFVTPLVIAESKLGGSEATSKKNIPVSPK